VCTELCFSFPLQFDKYPTKVDPFYRHSVSPCHIYVICCGVIVIFFFFFVLHLISSYFILWVLSNWGYAWGIFLGTTHSHSYIYN